MNSACSVSALVSRGSLLLWLTEVMRLPDDGTLVGLRRSELVASLKTLERMAEELGATVLVVKEIRLPTLPSGQLDVGDSAGSRKRWERFQAGLEKLVSATGQDVVPAPAPEWASPGDHSGVGKRRYVREKKWQDAMASQGGTSSSMATTSDSASTPGGTHSESAGDLSSASFPGLTDELTPFTKSQSRSVNRKKYGSILDDAPIPAGHHPHPTPPAKSDKPFRRPRKPKEPAVRSEPEDDTGGIFGSVFDLDLSDPFAPLPPVETPGVSAKKKREDVKAAKKKVKKALKASPSLLPAAGGVDDDGWVGQSLDVWGADGPLSSAAAFDSDVAPLSLDVTTLQSVGSQTGDAVEPPSSSRQAETTSSSTPQVSSDSLTPSPSPLLVPTYRPPPSLLPRAFPVRVDRGTAIVAVDDALDEDGTERLCVEVLVCRKDMENHLNLEDFGRWDVETVLAGDDPDEP